ncbi:type II secretion system protein [Candidatus Nomurabacteria bacterium]|nr:type II secretion system protein [Candidatus Nomurabacteria bacterium]
MRAIFVNNRSGKPGFTLVEVMVVAPLVLMIISAIVVYMSILTGESLRVNTKNAMSVEVQEALNMIEIDASRSIQFLESTGSLSTPQGIDNNTAAFTSNGTGYKALILRSAATTKDYLNPERNLVYYANKPNPCGLPNSIERSRNNVLTTTLVYFTKTSGEKTSLWKRTILPTWNTSSPADTHTVCDRPWQQNSCAPDFTWPSGSRCVSKDQELVQNIKDFSITYYSDASSTTGESNPTPSMRTVEVKISTEKTVTGEAIGQKGEVNVTRENYASANLTTP